MEFLNDIWQQIAPYLAGLSIGGILTAVISKVLLGGIEKLKNKLDIDATVQKCLDKTIEKTKEISFKQSIQPLVESELRKITEETGRYVEKYCGASDEKLSQIVKVLEKFSAYFDNSIGIPDSAKQELKDAIAEAKGLPTSVETVIIDKPTGETAKTEQKTSDAPKKTKSARR